jgi:membrane peptidoglycan carboxypeptidase
LRGAGRPAASAVLALDRHHPDYVALKAMPPWLPAAFLTAEDGRFFAHPGFDLEMIRRALAHDFQVADFARGASTITQQLAKNLFLGSERTMARKLEELVLAWRLHELLPKRRILELYLNVIELGPSIRGVKRAAEVYFGKSVAALTPLEAAHLAALTPNPLGYARRFREGRVDEGWLHKLYDLLGMMKRSGRLTAAEMAAARNARLMLNRI